MRALPPLAQLRAFEAAARQLSFKGAAAELGVTPTAISHQIRLLESYVGCALFRRRPRPLALTENGQQLFPVIRDGLDSFSLVLSNLRTSPVKQTLRVSTTNAFASRWLVPRLHGWRASRPHQTLEVIGTDRVLDLDSGECDLAIRWSQTEPPGETARAILHSAFAPVCSPQLLTKNGPLKSLQDLRHHTILHWYWSPDAEHPPTWRWWLTNAKANSAAVPNVEDLDQLTFKEELHAIDAAIAGQGIAICDEVLVADALRAGKLVRPFYATVQEGAYYTLYKQSHTHRQDIEDFVGWIATQSQEELIHS